jgi:hypothetical protein
VYQRISLLSALLIFARPLPPSTPCSAYPAGTWRFDKASTLRFEREWLQALVQKNVTALDCMFSGEFQHTSTKGVLRPKTQVLRELPLRSNTAVVLGVNVIADRQGYEILRIRFTDVLRFADGRWLAVAAQETFEQQPEP